jgi:hypothetical protein
VPLQDGRWVATKDNSVTYELPTTDFMGQVPPGLDDIQLVHKSASSRPSRLRLLQKLSINQFDSRQVCSLIVAQHKRDALESYELSVLISHAVYLFRAQYNLKFVQSAEDPMLWLCTSEVIVKRASDLYIDMPDEKDPVSLYLRDGPARNFMLHNDIVDAARGPKSKEWLQWLVGTLKISPFPRVATSSGNITEEFAYFLKNRLPSVSLRHLVRHWSVQFPNDRVTEGARRAISLTEIAYDGHRKQTLGELSLACKELKKVAPKGLPFLDLPNIEDESWHLKAFGVGVTENFHFVRHCINTWRGKEATKKDVTPLYQLLQRCFARDENAIRYVPLTC